MPFFLSFQFRNPTGQFLAQCGVIVYTQIKVFVFVVIA
jgi:hypothetical protein